MVEGWEIRWRGSMGRLRKGGMIGGGGLKFRIGKVGRVLVGGVQAVS